MNIDSIKTSLESGTRQVAGDVYWYTLNYPVTTFLVLWVLFIGVAYWGVMRLIKNKYKGKYKMAQRKAYLDRLYADMIGDGLADLLHQGKISTHEYRKGFKTFGLKYGLTDLMPRKTHPQAIKTRVKKNCLATKLLDQNGNPIQPSIPGPKPGETVLPAASREPKRWVIFRKKLLRRVA